MNIKCKIGTLLVFVCIYCVSLFNIAKADTPLASGVGYSYNLFVGGNFFDVKEVEPQLYVIPRNKLGIKIKITDAIAYSENLLH